jgi:hypothetical protein
VPLEFRILKKVAVPEAAAVTVVVGMSRFWTPPEDADQLAAAANVKVASTVLPDSAVSTVAGFVPE